MTWQWRSGLDNIPNVLGGMAELTARDAGAQTEVADTDRIILELIGKVILTFSHGTDKDADALFRPNILDVVFDSYHFGIVTESNLPTVVREVVCDWVFYHLEQFFWRARSTNR